MVNYYFEVLKKYAVINGRARRREYWIFTLVNLAVGFCAGAVSAYFGHKVNNSLYGDGGNLDAVLAVWLYAMVPFIIYFLIIAIPGICVSVRRLHDIGRSGWWVLLLFMIAGGNVLASIASLSGFKPIIFLVVGIGQIVWLFFALTDSQSGDNKYGPNPKVAGTVKK